MAWSYENELKLWHRREKLLIANKTGGRLNFALVYPNSYRVGMSNLGIHIIYELLNSRPDVNCERFFLPEKSTLEKISRANLPLLSLETQTPLNKFQIVGFAISFELDYFNVIRILRISKIKIRSIERTRFDPIIIAGGPCATFNPAPMSKILDAFVIGEGEIVLPSLIDEIIDSENLSRLERLERVSQISGIYVPSSPKITKRCWVKNLDSYPAHSAILTEEAEFNMYLLEPTRGCGRHCRFCMAGYCFRRPRKRSIEILKSEILKAKHFSKKIGLMGAAISDYPDIDELCDFILRENLQISVASFRADSVSYELIKLLITSGLKTLTIAPEVGSEKMRAVVNKGITNENIFKAIEFGIKAGLKNFRLYFMVGLPFERLVDVEKIVELTLQIKNFIGNLSRLTVSVNPFVPKPFTPFQWCSFSDRKYLEMTYRTLSKLNSIKGIKLILESIRDSEIQAILSRGDEKISEIILHSETLKDFRKNFENLDLDKEYYLRRSISHEEILPWDILNQRFTKDYLYRELKRAANFEVTTKCFEGCARCGICGGN